MMPGRGERPPLWLSALLALYPASFRRAHAEEVAAFVASERQARRAGPFATRLAGAVWITGDLLRGAWRARRRSARLPDDRGGSVERAGDALRGVLLAGRGLVRAPTFTATVVGTLGLGIGLGTSIFSALNAVILRPFDYAEPERLAYVTTRIDGTEDVALAGGTLVKMRARTTAFEELAGVAVIRQNLTGPELPRQVEVGWATPNLFDVLGVGAGLGRTFREDDPMGTALLSWRTWQRDFGGDPAIVGEAIELDGHTYTVVGVLERGFMMHLGPTPRDIDVWKVPDTWWQNGNIWDREGVEFGLLRGIGRLSPGVTIETARADLDRVAELLRAEVPSYAAASFGLTATPLRAHVVSSARPILLLLMGAVFAVVLIACANVTGLMLVRAEDRRSDVAIRLALGSGPRRVAAGVLAESALLAGAGGALGLILGAAGTRLLPLVAPANVPRLAESAVDTRVLVFAGTITLLCTLVVGIGPAVGLARRLPGSPSGARLIGDRRGGGVRRALVVAQVAASLALMVCAGLLAGRVNRLGDVDTGFDDDDVLTFAISLPGARYGWPIETDAFFRRLEERVRALPGVSAAAVVWPLPFDGRRWDGSFTGGAIAEDDRLLVRYELVTPTFFETLDIPLHGAAFGADDPKRAVIVSRSLADRAWPGENPLGRTLRALPWGQDTVTFRVIGVAGDVRFVSLQERPGDVVYFDSRGYAWTDWEVNFVVRARGDIARLAEGIRAEVAGMDPEIPVASIRPLADLVRAGMATERFARTVFVIFAGFAGLLVVIGLYGVVSYGVRLRRREFGIRMALGLEKGGVLRLVLTQGFGLAFAGVLLGLAGAVAAAGALRAWLFGLTTLEPAVYLSAAFGMLAIALIATLIPAWAATRLDPANVLRSE